jgi:PAS domain S-box-containing protein
MEKNLNLQKKPWTSRHAQWLCHVMFRNPIQAIFISDAAGRITEVNSTFTALFGYSAADACTLAGKEITDISSRQAIDDKMAALRHGEIDSFRLENRYRRKDGSLFWGDCYVAAVPEKGKTVDAIITAVTDVTEKKEIQDAIQQRDAFIRALYDKAAQAISSTDNKGRFIEVNPAFEAMFGYTREEALKLTHMDITAPEHIQISKEKADLFFQGKIDAYRLEKTYRRKDGSIFWGDLSIRALQRPDGGVQSVAVIVDITERKEAEKALQKHRDDLEQRVNERTAELSETNRKLKIEITSRARVQNALKESEERFRTIFETTTDHVFLKDSDLRYTMVNPCMARLFEMPAPQITGLTDAQLFGEEANQHLQQVDKRVLAGETIEEVHSRTVKGSLMTFFDNRTPMRDNTGNIVGICGISRDITERRYTQTPPDDMEYDYPSAVMRETLIQAKTVARTETIVLITGESGVGKDHLAGYIHMRSPRSGGPFFTINCGAIPHELAESELFGHERGAFSGAIRKKRGLFELAEGGTVLLNEVGELPLLLQVKLLSFLDTFTFARVGGEKKITVNIRILAATNRNLEKEVAAGRFRQDLYYRLNIVPIRVPPLRERAEDIAVIAREILDKLVLELHLSYKPEIGVHAMQVLNTYPWPGNVRELRNAIERAIILSKGPRLIFDFLNSDACECPPESWTIPFPPQPSLNAVVTDLKNNLIMEALRQVGGRKAEAARLLGISRYTLMRQLKKED